MLNTATSNFRSVIIDKFCTEADTGVNMIQFWMTGGASSWLRNVKTQFIEHKRKQQYSQEVIDAQSRSSLSQQSTSFS